VYRPARGRSVACCPAAAGPTGSGWSGGRVAGGPHQLRRWDIIHRVDALTAWVLTLQGLVG